MENEEKEIVKEKKGNKLIPIIIAAVIVVIVGATIGIYIHSSSPKNIVSKVIEKTYEKYDKVMNNTIDYDFSKDTLKVSGDLNVDTNIDGLEKLKNDKFTFDIGVDYKSKKLEAGLAVDEKKTTLIDIMAYIVDNKLYLDLGKDYDGLLKTDDVNFEDFLSIDLEETKNDFTKEDINYIVKAYKNILIKSIDEKDLKKSTDTIKINGKDTKVNKISYTINDQNIEKLTKKMIEETLKDNELIKKLAKVFGKEVVDVKYELEEQQEKFTIDEDLNIKLDIYTKGITNSFAGLNMRADKDNYLNLTVNKKDSNVVIKSDDTKIDLDINKLTDEEANIDYNVKYEDTKLSGNLTYNNKKIDNKRYQGKVIYYMNYNKQKLKLTLDYKLKVNVPIAKIDTNKAKDITEADGIEDAYNNIMDRFQKSTSYDMISNLFSY